MPLAETYRPSSWSDVIGQPKTLATLERLRSRGQLAGRAYWISGASGTGKTTIARLIAREIADSWAIVEIDAQDLTMDFLREMEEAFHFRALGEKQGKAWIINEAHGMRGTILSRLLTLLEPEDAIPSHVAIIFTTTHEGQESLFADYADASPLLSRCLPLALARRDLCKPFAERAREIAQREGLDGKPIAAYQRLLNDCRQNLRLALQRIEAGEMLD